MAGVDARRDSGARIEAVESAPSRREAGANKGPPTPCHDATANSEPAPAAGPAKGAASHDDASALPFADCAAAMKGSMDNAAMENKRDMRVRALLDAKMNGACIV